MTGTRGRVGAPGAARAEPISATIAAVTAFLGTSVGIGSLTVGGLLQFGLFAAGVAGSLLARGGGRNQAIDPGELKGTFETADSPEIRAIGRVRLGGVKAFGNTQDARRARLILHAKGLVDGIEQHFLGGREVVVDPDGAVASPPYVRPGGSYVYLFNKAGSAAETAWDALIALFPTLWTADHRVRGIAQTLAFYDSPGINNDKFLKLYQSGAPDLEVILRAERVYDPRSGTTAWSDNGILCTLHVMLTFPSLALADFDLAFIGAEADRADVLVATRIGTERRSRCWGVWNSELERGSLLQQVLDSAGAEIVWRPGDLVGIRLIDDAPQPDWTVPVEHIRKLGWKSGPESVERPNICEVRYYSPERNYELYDVDLTGTSWHRIEDEIARVGEQKVSYSLPFCPSAAQAQRVARRKFAQARGDVGTLRMDMVGLALWGLNTATIPLPELDEALLCRIEPARVDDEQGEVELPYQVCSVLPAWNPATDEALPPPVIPDLGYQSTLPTPDAPTATTVVTYPDAGKASRLAYAIPAGAGITMMEAVYRVITAGLPGPWTSMAEAVAPSGFSHAFTATDLSGLSCQFRVRAFNAAEDGSLWSPVFAATLAVDNTAPPAPTIGAAESTVGEVTTVTITATAPSVLNVASLEITGAGSPGVVATLPGEQFGFTFALPAPTSVDQGFTWTARAFASDGTASAIVSVTVIVPATGGP